MLFGEHETEDILPVRLITACRKKLSSECSIEKCEKYRIGTLGSIRISWDKRGARI